LGRTEDWRRLHYEELYGLYASPNIIRAIKSRRMRWVGHVARTEKRGVYRVLVGKPEGKRHLEDLDIDRRIILKLIFKKRRGCMDSIGLAQIGAGGGLL
jgi:hypothetical protein